MNKFKDGNFNYTFIRYPRALIDNPEFLHISIEARTLLAMIFDRYTVSEINSDRFTDKNGGIYVIYTVEELCKKLGCSKTKVHRLFNELETCGMIKRYRDNRCRPSRIQITPLFIDGIKSDYAKSQNKPSRSLKTGLREDLKSADSNNNISNNKHRYNNSSIRPTVTEDEIRERIEYDCLVYDENKNLLDEIVAIICGILNSSAQSVRIGKEDLSGEKVREVFSSLDSESIVYVISGLKNPISKIRNLNSYLTTLLYNAPESMERDVTVLFPLYHSS